MKRSKELYFKALRDYELASDEVLRDDVIYCTNCNTIRVFPDFVNDDGTLIHIACQCRDMAHRKLENAEKEWARKQKIAQLKEISLMDERYSTVSFLNTRTDNPELKKAYDKCVDYCLNAHKNCYDGKGIYISGEVGVGKTHLTACMANELLEQGFKVKFTNISRIADLILTNDTTELNQVRNCDFLFIDDFGKELVWKNGSDGWLQQKVFNLINDRYNAMRPMIFSSNYTLMDLLAKHYDRATIDRIREMNEQIEVKGENWR